MNLAKIFINEWGRLRSGWRLSLFALVYIVLQLIIGSISFLTVNHSGLGLPPGGYFENAIFRLVLLSSALLAGYICTRFLEGLPWLAIGLTLHRNWMKHFLLGSLIGAGALAFAAAIATAGGGLSFSLVRTSAILLVFRALISAAALFILAALAEEALFRGYPLQTLTRARLAWLGVLLTSIPFAAVHLRNPNVVQGFTFLNTALAGVWFAVAYLRTRSLWFPLGLHWAWNWTLDSILGLPVSGMKISPQSLLTGLDLGPSWLTGGSYGIEGGVAGTIALVVATVFVWRARFVSAAPEMLALTSHENPAAKSVSVVPKEAEAPRPLFGRIGEE
ncbi:MAG TPA: CPBP family intramembrane glutamic endopeptidase [Pyrinomonadaceae bacterium]|nr:CPBP family intramembrane glutamic endopeptidase [Pyrinomonadaceae bacterium]HLE63603.1 CPBP family intramembrane glutamic endopeptidase [Pyrinomonadaceae bacterium]